MSPPFIILSHQSGASEYHMFSDQQRWDTCGCYGQPLGIRDNTLVVFTTDHGHFFGQHGLTAKGAFHYEDLIRIPFLISQPGPANAPTRCKVS